MAFCTSTHLPREKLLDCAAALNVTARAASTTKIRFITGTKVQKMCYLCAMNRKELEIMAPAGNFGCLMAAIEGGADSVYFGIGHLNMRSHSANNFGKEDLPEIIRICRAYGVKA